MSWNIEKPGDRINGPLTITGNTTLTGTATISGDLTVDTNTLKVDATNNRVGVGTASPSVPLDVVGNAKISGDLVVDTNTLVVDSTNNRLGIGTATPDTQLHVKGTGSQTISVERDGATISGRLDIISGNSTNLLRATTAKPLVFEQGTGVPSMTLDSSGRLGIGTATVDGKVHIYGDTYANSQLRIQRNGAVNGTFSIGIAGTNNTLYIQDEVNATARLIIDGSGNLGLGVTPAFRFHVYSLVNNETRFQTASTTAGHTNRLSFSVPTGTADTRSGVIEWYDLNTFKGDMRFLKAGGLQIRNSADSPTVTLDDSGNLGVGVAPTSRLTVLGSDATSVARFNAASGRLRFAPYSSYQSTNGVILDSTNTAENAYQPFAIAGSSVFLISDSGNCVLTSDGRFRVSTQGSASTPVFSRTGDVDTGLYFPANNTLALAVGGSDAVYIDSSRNVGIGTNPGYKLDIRDNSTGLLARLSSTSTGGCSMQFVSTSTNGRTYRIGSNYVSGAGEFSIYDDTAGLERLRIKSAGQLRFVPLASDPGSAEAGDVYYNSTTNKLRCYNGTAWNDLF